MNVEVGVPTGYKTELHVSILLLTGVEFRLALDSLSSRVHGIIEARVNGIWGRVCLHDFDDSDASVACRHFGFDGGVAYLHIMKNDRPVLVRDVRCNGNKLLFSLCRERRPTSDRDAPSQIRPSP